MQVILMGFLMIGFVGCANEAQTPAPAHVANSGIMETELPTGETSPESPAPNLNTPENSSNTDTNITETSRTTVFVSSGTPRIIDNNGDLYGWLGNIGNGSNEGILTPTKIMGNVKSIVNATSAIDNNDNLWSWGNWQGTELLYPTMVFENVQEVRSGHILTKNGDLWNIENNLLVLQNVQSYTAMPLNTSIFAITTDDTLWAWGANHWGQLGDGSFTDRDEPVRIMENVAHVSGLNFHGTSWSGSAFIITQDGSLYATGANHRGQLGNGSFENANTPQFIMDNVASVYYFQGLDFSVFAITKDNSLYSWGTNEFGTLGNGTFFDESRPVHIMDNVRDVVGASLSPDSGAFSITTDNILYGWGRHEIASLGDGSHPSAINQDPTGWDVVFNDRNSPVWITDNVHTLNTTGVNNFILTTNNELAGWGLSGFLGNGRDSSLVPMHIMDVTNVLSFHPVWMNTNFVVTTNGTLYAWGSNSNGILGDGTNISRDFPVRIMENVQIGQQNAQETPPTQSQPEVAPPTPNLPNILPTQVRRRNILATRNGGLEEPPSNGIVLKENGTMLHWNWYSSEELMNNVISIGDGLASILSDGHLWTYRAEFINNEVRRIPVKIMDNVIATSTMQPNAVSFFTFVLTADGNLWGSLGSNFISSGEEPVLIMSNIAIVDGTRAITTDGILWELNPIYFWESPIPGIQTVGYNPTKIMDNVIAISQDFVVTSDNNLFNLNTSWQPYDEHNRIATAYNPTHILSNVSTVSSSWSNTLALRTDGTLWAWGENRNGEVGDGTTTARETPIQVLENVVELSSGIGISMAVTADGGFWAWGENYPSLWIRDNNSNFAVNGTPQRDSSRLRPARVMDGVRVR